MAESPHSSCCWTHTHIMNSMKLVIRLHFISWNKDPNDAVTPQRQSQFTPKMKANAVPRLLSSLVWIDQYMNVTEWQVPWNSWTSHIITHIAKWYILNYLWNVIDITNMSIANKIPIVLLLEWFHFTCFLAVCLVLWEARRAEWNIILIKAYIHDWVNRSL